MTREPVRAGSQQPESQPICVRHGGLHNPGDKCQHIAFHTLRTAMLVISEAASLSRVQDPHLHQHIAHRAREIEDDLGDAWEGFVRFFVVEPDDTTARIDETLGFSLKGRPRELIEDLGLWFEIVFVLSDDGSGVIVLVPMHSGIDAALLHWCAEQVAQARESPQP